MAEPYSIGELARAAGVPTSTVRYYERLGLLRPAGRTRGNHRFYDEDAVERLRFIRAAQGAGFTLEDVTTLIELRDGSLAPCAEVETLILGRLDEIAARMADFRRVQKRLREALALCRAPHRRRECAVLDDLTEKSRKPG